ncbi:transcriptional regulator [Pasteurella multocida]|nr:transcriptional regulator [Pasteurella multocida]
MTKTLLTQQELQTMGIGSRTKIYLLVKNEDFPKPLKYGRVNRWLLADVMNWIEKQNPNKVEKKHEGIEA